MVHAVERTSTSAKALALEIVAPRRVGVEAPKHIAEADASPALAHAQRPTYLQTDLVAVQRCTNVLILDLVTAAVAQAGVVALQTIAVPVASQLSGAARPGAETSRRMDLAEARTNTRAPTLVSEVAAAPMATVVVL